MTNKKTTILLGITGSIAAYKMADVASDLTKKGFNVETIMTENATKLIDPIVFSTLTGNKCIVKTFDKNVNYNVAHISLAKKTSIILVAPATANIIAKLAYGIADDMLTTTLLACNCIKLISPAMNTNMYNNPTVQRNLKILEEDGWKIIEPDSGILACKDEGVGKLPKPEVLVDSVIKNLDSKKDLIGKNVLITAGPTREKIDAVRFITNHSSGKMGYNLAQAAKDRGANVTLITGKTNLTPPTGINVINIDSAQDMFEAVKNNYQTQDYIIKAAAVADFTPKSKSDSKIKKSTGFSTIELEPTTDILKFLGENKKENQILCGFSMETDNLIENSKVKLGKKNADLICANSINDKDSAFENETNKVTIITKDNITELPVMPKIEVAHSILDKIKSIES